MRFDIDTQRGAICLFGMVCLAVELIAFYLTGKTPPGELTGGFFTMAIGPVVSTTWQRYNEYRNQGPGGPASKDGGDLRQPPQGRSNFRECRA
jgi:hypothetical protein